MLYTETFFSGTGIQDLACFVVCLLNIPNKHITWVLPKVEGVTLTGTGTGTLLTSELAVYSYNAQNILWGVDNTGGTDLSECSTW